MQLRDPIARNGLSSFLHKDPDGRVLRDYNVTAEELESLLWYVRSHEHFHWKDRDCAALVLVFSEWTYQHATRLQAFWWDALSALNVPFREEPALLYKRFEEGLAYLKRPARTPPNWIATFIAEGGFPRRLDVKGLDAVLDRIFENFSWSFLAAAFGNPRHAATITKEIVRLEDDPSFSAFAGEMVAPIVTELVAAFSAYRRDLGSTARPQQSETVTEWAQRLAPDEDPLRRLPFRTIHATVFADLLFPRLRSGVGAGGYVQPYRDSAPRLKLSSDASAGSTPETTASAARTASHAPTAEEEASNAAEPLTIRVVWPIEELEPLVTLRLPNDELPAAWLHGLAPALVNCSRLAVSPAGLPSLSETLEAAGKHFKRTRSSPWMWRLPEVRGRTLSISRRSLKGITEVPTGILVPNPMIVIADASGRTIALNSLVADTEYRAWLPHPPRRVSSNVQRRSESTFLFRGTDGEAVTFETDEDTFELSISNSPLGCELTGRRWISERAAGPYIGLPMVQVNTTTRPEIRTGTTSWQPLQGGPTMYSLPSDAPTGRLRAFVRAENKSREFRFSLVPANTSYRLHPPTDEGTRALAIVSTGLRGVRVLRDEIEVAACTTENAESKVRILLPSIDERQRYRVELNYGTTIVAAPLWDSRRIFRIDLGGDFILMTQGSDEPPRIERALARYASMEASGLRPDEVVSLHVRSINRGRRLDEGRFFQVGTADLDGTLRTFLAGIVDDLDPCARHQLSFVVQEDARRLVWRIDVDDTIFAKEPESDEPYGALASRSQIRGHGLSWGWVPAARQWEPVQFAPMMKVHDGWRPPATEIPAGGLLAAPFDGEHRVGYVRYVVGPELVDDEPLCVATAQPHGFDLPLLRREFAHGCANRQRLCAILMNLATFNAGASLTVPSVCALDGAVVAYAAMRNEASAPDGSLRAIPAGAWLRSAKAMMDDEGEWVSRMYGSAPEALALIALLRKAGLPTDKAYDSQLDHLAEDLTTRRPSKSRAPTDPAGVDVQTPATLLDYDRRLPPLLDDWRRGDRGALREHPIDPRIKELATVHPEVREYLTQRYQDLQHFVEAPLALASAAARVTLDPALDGRQRRTLRTLMCAQQQVRAWDRFEPLVGALHAFALCAHWRSLRAALSHAEQARSIVERIEVQ